MARTKLTPKQEKFVAEYLLSGNATQSAIKAGYSEHTAQEIGAENLSKPMIKKAVEAGQALNKSEMEARAKNKGITEDKWRASVAEVAFADIDTFIYEDPITGKMRLKKQSERPKGSGRLIRKITIDARGDARVELHPKHPAQELLARHFGWIYDKIEHSGSIQTPTASESEMKRIMSDPDAARMALELAEKLSNPGQKPEGGTDE